MIYIMFLKRVIKYIFLKMKWRKTVSFAFSSKIGRHSSFEGMNKIYPHAVFIGDMGLGSYIGYNSQIQGKIGRYTSIASHCQVIIGTHPYTYPFVSTSPMFYSLQKQTGYTFAQKQKFEEYRYTEGQYSVIIGNDCWIGEKATIVSGVRIHDGAVVLACAVVTKDVPPYAIVGGVPAKVIKYRYDEDTIKMLLINKWWERSDKWLKENWMSLCDMDELKKQLQKEL